MDALGRSHSCRLPLASMLHSQSRGSPLDSAGGPSGENGTVNGAESPSLCGSLGQTSPGDFCPFLEGPGETLLEFSSCHDKHHHLKAVWLTIQTKWLCILADHLLEKNRLKACLLSVAQNSCLKK